MDREEILAKSREEREDEGEKHAQTYGDKWGLIAMVISFFVLFVGTLIINEDKSDYLLPSFATFFSMLHFNR